MLSAQRMKLPVVAYDAASLSIAQLAEVRLRSIERFASSLRPQLLKHSDEQTLAAAVVLDRAIAQMRPDSDHEFSRWAVISATRYLGRTAFAAVIDKYKVDGPWGVSVQVIPHTSPHALASSLSLALGSHGPCFGAGAAPRNELDALFTAATLLEQPEIAGAWIVFSGWTDASSTDDSASSVHCQAAVLAILPRRTAAMARPVGEIAISQEPHCPAERQKSHPLRTDLLNWLVEGQPRGASFLELTSGGMAIRIELPGAPRLKSRPDFEPHRAAPSTCPRPRHAAGALTP